MKCVATIVDRHYLGENAFIFSFNNCLVGDYDEEFDVFTDKNGNEYLRSLDPSSLYSEVPQGFFNVIKIEDIKKLFPEERNLSTADAIALYNDMCHDISYIVGVGKDGTVFTMPLNIGDLIDGLEQFEERQIEEEYEDYEYEKNMEEGVIPEEYADLIMEIINGRFNLDELKTLRKSLVFGRDNIDSVLDTLDLQIEADTMGVPYEEVATRAYEEEQKEKEKKVITTKKIDTRSEYEKRGLMDVDKLFDQITKTLIAQDEPTRRMLIELAKMDLGNQKKKGILLTGESGVGKTLLMSLIAKYCNRPFLMVDSTQLTVPGIVGKSIEEYLWKLYVECGKDKEKAERAIVFFDEIDKKGSSKKDDVSGKGVLNILLKFLDGTTYEACENGQHKSPGTYTTIDTSKMKVVLGGAFTDVYKNMKPRNSIGFGTSIEPESSTDKTPTMEDFVSKAMMSDEFMGRVPILIKMNDLDETAIKRIMLEGDESALKQEESAFEQVGVKLSVTPEYLDAIAHKAFERKTGARGLDSVITSTTWKPFDHVYRHIGEYEEVILDEETVKDSDHFQLVKKKGIN